MIPLDYMLSKMLDDACPSSLPDDAGWSTYRIELCCMVYVLTARKRNGVWQVRDWTIED